MDLSDNKTPFGLLTPEEQEHLRNWPHGVQMYRGQIGWIDSGRIAWAYSSTNTYRTKPAPKPVTRVDRRSTTVVDRLRKLEGVMEEPKNKPNPWTDV